MLNLIKMDFGSYKSSFITILLYAIIFPAAFDSFAVVGTIAFLCIYMVIFTALLTEEKDRIDLLHKSLPVTSREIVGVKYIEAIITWFISVTVSIIAIKGIGYIKEINNMNFYMFHNFRNVMFMLTAVFAAAMTMISIALPVAYKFGVGKSRIILTAVWFAAAFGFPAVSALVGVKEFHHGTVCLAMLAAAIVLMVVSFFISVRIYDKK